MKRGKTMVTHHPRPRILWLQCTNYQTEIKPSTVGQLNSTSSGRAMTTWVSSENGVVKKMPFKYRGNMLVIGSHRQGLEIAHNSIT